MAYDHKALAAQVQALAEQQVQTNKALEALSKPAGPSGGPSGVLLQSHADVDRLKAANGGRLRPGIGWGEYLKDAFEASHRPSAESEKKMLEKHGVVLASKAALSGASGAVGGYTVPQQFVSQLMALVVEEAFVRAMCTALPMTARSALVPALNQVGSVPTNGTAQLGGVVVSWGSEAGTIAETEPTFKQIELVANELQAYSVIANSLIQDSAISLDALLSTLIVKALAWAVDYAILRGTGAGQPLGVLTAPATISVTRTTSNRFKLADSANMLSRLHAGSMGPAVWIMSQTMLPELIQLADAGNNVVWIPNFAVRDAREGGGAAQALPMQLHGKPIYITEKLPALGTRGDVLLCDLSQYLVGERVEVQMDVSPHVAFRTAQTAWRFIARIDGQPWLSSAVTLADGATTVSPFVTLAA